MKSILWGKVLIDGQVKILCYNSFQAHGTLAINSRLKLTRQNLENKFVSCRYQDFKGYEVEPVEECGFALYCLRNKCISCFQIFLLMWAARIIFISGVLKTQPDPYPLRSDSGWTNGFTEITGVGWTSVVSFHYI